MNKLKIMVSSVVRNLQEEREAIQELFSNEKFSFIELIGANPYDKASFSESSGNVTVKWARECDLYILILGADYGMETDEGKSATEVEYDAAIKMDPTKVLVFMKNINVKSKKQKLFIKKVSDYYSGYFRTTFSNPQELLEKVEASFWIWLMSRAQIGKSQTYADHFIRVIKEEIQCPGVQIYYKLSERFVEISISYNGQRFIQHIENSELRLNFWVNVNRVRREVNKFLEG